MLAKLGLRLLESTPFFLDSQSAEDLAMNPVNHRQSKHIEIKYHWVREHVDQKGEYKTAHLVHVRTGDQSADIFTKALTGTEFDGHRKRTLGEETKTSMAVARDNTRRRRR